MRRKRVFCALAAEPALLILDETIDLPAVVTAEHHVELGR
jgi:ABC-type taurine transport system ATPase subunit